MKTGSAYMKYWGGPFSINIAQYEESPERWPGGCRFNSYGGTYPFYDIPCLNFYHTVLNVLNIYQSARTESYLCKIFVKEIIGNFLKIYKKEDGQ